MPQEKPMMPAEIISGLRNMAINTKNLSQRSIRLILEAVNLIEEQEERIAIMTEQESTDRNVTFP